MTRLEREAKRLFIENKLIPDYQYYCVWLAGAEWADSTNPYKQLCNEMYVVLCWTKTKLKHMGYEVSGGIDVVFDKYEAMKNDSSQ